MPTLHTMKSINGAFLLSATLLTTMTAIAAESPQLAPPELRQNIPEMIEADGRLRLSFGSEHLVLPRGLQPSLLRTASGALVVQAQIPEKPFPTSRMVYPYAME